jgi:hypothetical protein
VSKEEEKSRNRKQRIKTGKKYERVRDGGVGRARESEREKRVGNEGKKKNI